MDRWEWTKVGTAIGAAIGVMAAGVWFAGLLVDPTHPRQRGYAVTGVPPVDLAAVQRAWPIGDTADERGELLGYIVDIEKASVPVAVAAGGGPAADTPVDLGTLLASADPERGRRAAQSCMACHDMSPNGPNRIGPNLWGMVGRPVARSAGFAYSPALSAMGGQWTYQELDDFLAAPSRAVPGTKMAFGGIRNPRERAHLIAFLATIGASKPPFPPPEAATPLPEKPEAKVTP